MNKIFKYTRQTSPSYYSDQTDEEFYNEEDFDYEADMEEIQIALANIISQDYFINVLDVLPNTKNNDLKKKVLREIKKSIKSLVANNDLEEIFSEIYEDELTDYFEEDAMNSLNKD